MTLQQKAYKRAGVDRDTQLWTEYVTAGQVQY